MDSPALLGVAGVVFAILLAVTGLIWRDGRRGVVEAPLKWIAIEWVTAGIGVLIAAALGGIWLLPAFAVTASGGFVYLLVRPDPNAGDPEQAAFTLPSEGTPGTEEGGDEGAD